MSAIDGMIRPMSPSFNVGATVRSVNGGGHLTVELGSLVLEPGPSTRKVTGIDRVAHASADRPHDPGAPAPTPDEHPPTDH